MLTGMGSRGTKSGAQPAGFSPTNKMTWSDPNFCDINKTSPSMQKLGSGVITTTHDVDCVEFEWGKIQFLSEPAVTDADRFSFGIVELSQGKGHARHNHPGSEEVIYVISGEGEQMVDDRPPVKVGPGASIYIPADVYHSTVNTGGETMKLIVVYSPAGPERLLREIPGAKVTPPAG